MNDIISRWSIAILIELELVSTQTFKVNIPQIL